MSNYLSILRPISTFRPYTSPITDSGIKTLTVSVSWAVHTVSTHDVAWKVWEGIIASSSWLIITLEEVDSSWRIKTIKEVDTAWKVWAGLISNTSWLVTTIEEVDSSWRMPDTFDVSWKVFTKKQQNTSWLIKTIEEVDSAWKVWHGVVANTSWTLYASTIIGTSYVIFNLEEVDVSWRTNNGLIVPVSYRVQPAILLDSSWKLQNKITIDASWMIKRSPNGNVSWKINEFTNTIPGINTHVVTVMADSTEVEPVSISINTDIDSLAWSATLSLQDEDDYDLCIASDSITVTIDNVSWLLKVKKQDKALAFIAATWQIMAISPFGIIADEQISLVLENDSLASVVAKTVVGSEIDFSWEAVNWNIPAEIKIAGNAKRGAVLNSLVEAIGAELVANPDGSISVLPGTPTDEQKDYPAAIWATDDLVSISYDITQQNVYKRVLTGSESLYIPREISISVLEKDDVNRTAVVGVWVSPNSIPPTVSDCGPSIISVRTQLEVIESKTETVTFKDGLATTGATIDSLTSVDWKGHTNLGDVIVIGSNQLLAAVAGFSIAEVIYKIKYYKYVVSASGEAEVETMVCASVDPIRSDIIADCQRGSGVLSPDVITHKFCTELPAATERGRVYLDKHSEDDVSYSVEKIWNGCALSTIGSVIELDTVLSRLVSLNIQYTFPAVQLSATLEKI